MAKKKKKKIYGPFSSFHFVPGTTTVIQENVPAMGTQISNPDFPMMAVFDIRGDPLGIPQDMPPSLVFMWLREQYTSSIFYPDDPADIRMGIGFAVVLNIVGGILWFFPPTKPAGTVVLAIPDYLVAIPLGIAASNLYQQADPVNQWNKAVGKPDHWSQWG